MSIAFRVDLSWVDDIPRKKMLRRIRDAVVSAILVPLSWLVHPYRFWRVLVGAIIHWNSEFGPPSLRDLRRFWKDVIADVRNDGLYRFVPSASGKDAVPGLAPWDRVEIHAVKRRKESIIEIVLLDPDLPGGVRKIHLKHLKQMDALLQEIQARVAK